MHFRVQGLDPRPFTHLYGLSDTDLAKFGARRYIVDANPGFPDRIGVRDLEIGETAILLSYEHQSADTPYRSRHAIFIHEGALKPLDLVDALPQSILIRSISLRAFDDAGEMIDADLADGVNLVPLIIRFFENPAVSYLHAHNAKRGCYSASIIRG